MKINNLNKILIGLVILFTTGTFVSADRTANGVPGDGIIGKVLQSLGGGESIWVATSSLGISGGSGSGNSAWTIGSGLIYNATSTDKVGVGTSTPAYPLTVVGTSSQEIVVSPNVNGTIVVDGIKYPKNSTGINSALAVITANGGNMALHLPCGVYSQTSRITVANVSNFVMYGDGDCTIIKAVNTLYSGGQTHYQGQLYIDGQTSTSSNLIFRDFVVDANNQATTTNITIGGGVSGTGIDNITFSNVTVKGNATGTESGAVNIFSGIWTGLYGNPHGLINNITFYKFRVQNSYANCVYMLGGGVTNLTVEKSTFENCRDHGFAFTEITDDLPTTSTSTIFGGADFGNYRTWRFTNNVFQNNFLSLGAGTRSHIMMNTSGGITDLVINKNYFGGMSSTTIASAHDYMALNLYNSLGAKITENYFGENLQVVSFGKSQAANYAKINPMQYTDLSNNTFYRSRKIFDNDASIGMNMHHNQIIETFASAWDGYSTHFPLNVNFNMIVNPNQYPELSDGSTCARSVFCVSGNEGLVFENNTIIDNRKLKNPTEAPQVATTTGGALGSRTYYVSYAWENINGETSSSSPESSITVSANSLLTVTLPSSINTNPTAGTSIGFGGSAQRIYVGTTSANKTLQGAVLQHTQSFTWTEPTTGIVASTTFPTTNTTQSRTQHIIYETNSNGDGLLPNEYRNNRMSGASSTPIVFDANSTSYSSGNLWNVNSNTGSDDIEYQLLPTVASSTRSIYETNATSSDYLYKMRQGGVGGFISIADKFGRSIFNILNNGRVGIGTSTPLSTLFVQGTSTDNPFIVASSTGASMFSLFSNGNVAIGRSSASARLDIDQTSAGDVFITRNSGSQRFTINQSGGTDTIGSTGTNLAINGANLTFLVGGSERGRFDTTTGNFGVGTTTVPSKVTIQGSGAINPLTIASSTGTTIFQILANSHIVTASSTATTPILSSCGTSPTIVGNDTAGTVTEGAVATGCTITFSVPYTVAPHCVVSYQSGLNASYTTTASALTITNIGALSSTNIDYHCIQ